MPSLYEMQGHEWFEAVIDRFYDAVETDSLLRPLYPDDLTESRSHMVSFLVQRFGGPTTYSERRGHPRLRMRHAPFDIGQAERDAWFGHMCDAVAAGGLDPDVEAQVLSYFDDAATFLINRQ